jgi:trk system potassium uptake protein TrkH
MIDFRPALFVIGILLTTIAVAMLAPFAVDLVNGHPDWQIFAGAGTLTLFVPASIHLNRGKLAGNRNVFRTALRLLRSKA